MPAEDLFAERRRKVDLLAERGVPAYGVDFTPTATMAGARGMLAAFESEHPAADGEAELGPEVAVAGRPMQLRLPGGTCFAHVGGEGGRVPVWFQARPPGGSP